MNKEKFLSICRRSCAIICASLIAALSFGNLSAYAASGIPDTTQDYPVFIGLPCGVSYDVNWGGNWVHVVGDFYSDDDVKFTIIGSTFYLMTEDVNATYTYDYVEPNAGDGETLRTFNSSTYVSDGTTTLYYKAETVVGYFFSPSQSVAKNQMYPDGAINYTGTTSDVNQIIAGWHNYVAPGQLQSSFSVPAGWVAYYKNSGNVRFNCYQPVASSLFGSSNPWSEGGQMYGYSASLPSADTVYPLSGMELIPWYKGYPRYTNGTTRNAEAVIAAAQSGQWNVVYNPLITSYYTESAGDDLPNGTIVVSVVGLAEVKMYPLSVSVTDGALTGSSNDDYVNPAIGTIDPDTGEVHFVDSEGNTVVPNVGGQNYTPEDITAQGFFERVLKALNDLVTGIGSLFGFAYEAIASLVSLAGPFISKLGALYSWLPSPVFSALTSAMVLAITIGVLKAFL